MEFETIERCKRTYVIKNGVESAEFIERDCGGGWGRWDFVLVDVGTASEGLIAIAKAMGNWYTAQEAAAWLVEAGVEKASAHDICLWARNGLLSGAVKITGKGGWGRGGSWRIPQAALGALAERRKGQ